MNSVTKLYNFPPLFATFPHFFQILTLFIDLAWLVALKRDAGFNFF